MALSAAAIIESAHQRVPGVSFQDTGFLEGFEILVKSLNEEADLPADSFDLIEQRFTSHLVNRLRMDKDFLRHPEIHEEVIQPPVVITSLPRTGSTKLHRLLAASDEFLSAETWKGTNLAPFPGVRQGGADPRIEACRDYVDWLGHRAPNAMIGHPMTAEEVEEDTLLIDQTFRSPLLHMAYFDVPSYVEWTASQDPCAIYRDEKRMLQYLQWQYHPGSEKRWLLKSPGHFGLEPAVNSVFPGTDFLVTHRAVEKCVLSGCCLLLFEREVYYDEKDFSPIVLPFFLTGFGAASAAHVEARRSNPSMRFFDIAYRDVVGDELNVVRGVFEFLGLPFSSRALEKCKQWLADEQKRARPRANYDGYDFSPSSEALDAAFGPYMSAYSAFL